MGQNTHKKPSSARMRESTREVILLWMDSYDIDGDNEAVDCLVRRIHAATFPFDADASTLLDHLVEALHWQADRIDGDRNAAALLCHAAEQLSDTFANAGLIERRCRSGATAPAATTEARSPGSEPAQCDEKPAGEEPTFTPDDDPPPMRRDLIYATEVDVRLEDGSRGTVAHPPFFGRVRMTPKNGRPRIVPLDDLCRHSQRALRSAPVRRRVEVHPRCSYWKGCTQTLRTFLTDNQCVEDVAGNRICGFDGLFHGLCPKHMKSE